MPENREDKTFIPIGYLDKTLCSILQGCNQFLHSLAIEALLFYNLYTEGYTFMYRMKCAAFTEGTMEYITKTK